MNSPSVASGRDPNGRFLKGSHWRPHAIFREREYLEREYVGRWVHSKKNTAREWLA